jgi:exosortase
MGRASAGATSPLTQRSRTAQICAAGRPGSLPHLTLLAVLLLSLLWSYGNSLAEMTERWARDPQYSHGFLVPVFAAFLLWLRRDRLKPAAFSPSVWGLLLLLAALALRLVGSYFYVTWLDQASLLPALAGVALLFGGAAALRWSWPAIAFLLFMVPLPYRLQVALAGPLQGIATAASTFVLQTFGLPALQEGNVIVLGDVRIGIVDACSGLTMLVTFFALATALALVVRRRPLDRVVMVACAAPVALVANVVRITATGVLHARGDSRLAEAVFHDWAGWLMMPLALALLAGVLHITSRLIVAVPQGSPEPASFLRLLSPGAAPAASLQTTSRSS